MSRTAGPVCRVELSGGVLVVHVASAQLRDVAGVSAFVRELHELSETHAEPRWLIDFGDVTFFITPAANTLLALMRRLRQRGGDLALTGLSADVQYVLRLLRLNNIFTTYPTLAAAVTDLQQAAALPTKAAEAG